MAEQTLETFKNFISLGADQQAYAIYMGVMQLEQRLDDIDAKISCLPVMSRDIEHFKDQSKLIDRIPDIVLDVDRLKGTQKILTVLGGGAGLGLVALAIEYIFGK